MVAHGRDDQHAVAVRHGRAAQHGIRRIGRIGIEEGFVDRLVDLGLARERRLVDLQRDGLDQFAVGRDGLAALDVDDVAHDHIAARNLAHRPAAHHLDRDVVVDLIQAPEAPLRVPLEPESDARGEDDGADDAHRLGEIAVDESDGKRQHGRDEQNLDDRIAELLQEEFPRRIVLGWRDDVVAVLPAALFDLLRLKAAGVVGNHGRFQNLFMENCRVEASSRTAMNSRIVKAMSDEPP